MSTPNAPHVRSKRLRDRGRFEQMYQRMFTTQAQWGERLLPTTIDDLSGALHRAATG